MSCHTPFYLKATSTVHSIPVGCGKCPYCKKRRVSSWVFRLLQEEKRCFSSYFITLTYDTGHIPITPKGYKTLDKTDFQKFMKRLRKLQKSNIKYYAAGEYGDKSYRPHYHAIIFNVEDYENINKAWNLGTTHIGDVSGASIAYTAKYIDKQKRIPMHKNDDRQKEFSLMSKKLGDNYLTPQVLDYHRSDLTRMYVTLPNGIRTAMPKYYRNIIFDEMEREHQRDIIIQVRELEIKKLELEFGKLYKNSDITFDTYLESLKLGEYSRFYNTFKKRNAL